MSRRASAGPHHTSKPATLRSYDSKTKVIR
jgi:hypothetical protein